MFYFSLLRPVFLLVDLREKKQQQILKIRSGGQSDWSFSELFFFKYLQKKNSKK